MQTLHLGDTLALYINRTDLENLGLTPSEHDLATLARRALAERGTSGDAGITLEVYPGGTASGELLLFCSPLARETVAFTTLAAAISAARLLTHRGRGSLHGSDPAVLARRPATRSASEPAPPASAGAAPSPTLPAPSDGTAPAGAGTSTSTTHTPHASLHLTEHNVWLLTLRATPRRAALLAAIAAEFGERSDATPSYLAEHAKLLIEQNAVEVLSHL